MATEVEIKLAVRLLPQDDQTDAPSDEMLSSAVEHMLLRALDHERRVGTYELDEINLALDNICRIEVLNVRKIGS